MTKFFRVTARTDKSIHLIKLEDVERVAFMYPEDYPRMFLTYKLLEHASNILDLDETVNEFVERLRDFHDGPS